MPGLEIYCHQEIIALSSSLIRKLGNSARCAVFKVLDVSIQPRSALSRLDEIEVSLVDDVTIAGTHLRFMDIAGATDVITFDHGEIHVSVETARCQALEFGNDFERELMVYIIHGLLHLAGHEDASREGRKKMDALQSSILKQVWQG